MTGLIDDCPIIFMDEQVQADVDKMLMCLFTDYNFSNGEKKVALLIMQGLDHKEIAEKLYIEETTSKYHWTSINKKTGFKSKHKFVANLYRALIERSVVR